MSDNTIRIIANGEPLQVQVPCSVVDFLEQRGWLPTQVVVEHNGRVLPRREMKSVCLSNDDRIEVILPVAGG